MGWTSPSTELLSFFPSLARRPGKDFLNPHLGKSELDLKAKMFQERQDRTNSSMNGKTVLMFGICKRSVFKESRSSPFAVDVTAWPT